MPDKFRLDVGQGIVSREGYWYKNVQFLGSGGNVVTFLVLSTSGPYTGNFFALKVFKKLSSSERRARFLEEVRFLRGCNHPAIMRIYDEGEFETDDATYPFVVAEYLPLTFNKIITSNTSIIEKLSYSLQLLSALSFLENQSPQIVHRDIKPQNIFVKGRSCVLGDFGLMKKLDGDEADDKEFYKESTGPGMPVYYRTPDLVAYARNEGPLTVKSDVFQLGLVIAELFTKRNPCRPTSNHLGPVELEQLSFIKGKLGAFIASHIRKMLSVDINERPYASEIYGLWERNFLDAVHAAHTLHGHIFD